MTKTDLQLALAEATQTNKKTAGVFLDTLSALAYKTAKKTGEFVLPGFGKLVKQKRKARTGFNPKTQQKIRIPAKTVLKFRVAKVAKDTVIGVKKVVGRTRAKSPWRGRCPKRSRMVRPSAPLSLQLPESGPGVHRRGYSIPTAP